MSRRAYLDWLRGVGVLIMIEAHTLDSWTRVEDRGRPEYGWAIMLGGFGAPIFLFLAGVALTLAAGSRLRRGKSDADVSALAMRRGWQIFGLAFLFRLQSALISGGALPDSLLKVDILNVMGVSMLAAAMLWSLGRRTMWRAVLLVSATATVTLLTPVIRESRLLDWLPDPVEWYFRPFPGRTTFTLFPWGGFLLGGAAVGLWLDSAQTPEVEAHVITRLAFAGPLLALGGYAASFLPPIYEVTSFWTSSPTFFTVRLGLLVCALPVAYVWTRYVRGWSPLQELGVASLFVYWIHVEMVYGILTLPIHRRLTFERALVAFALFSVFLYALVKLKDRVAGSSLGRRISATRRTSG